MQKLKSLVPCRSNHAVKEAVLTVFIDLPIADVATFEDLGKYGILDNFKRFEVIDHNELSITVTNNNPSVDSKKIKEVGFKYIDYLDGKPIKVFQGINETNRYYFSFHDLAYERWEKFKDMFDTCINFLSNRNVTYLVKAYSLHVIDEFKWEEESHIPYKDIFRDENKIIPSIFYDSNSIDYLISRNIKAEDSDLEREIERIQINGVNMGLDSKLIISHNYTEIMDSKTEALHLIQSSHFATKISDAHQKNKSLISDLLNDDVLEIIHFKN